MEHALAPSQTSPGIWGRVVSSEHSELSAEAARGLLHLAFDAADQRRVAALSQKARDGSLTPEERAELEEYVRVNNELMILQAKARQRLERIGNVGS